MNTIEIAITSLSGRKFHPETIAFKARAAALGGYIPPSQLSAADALVRDIYKNGLRSKIRRLNLFIGSSLGAAMAPLFNNADGSPAPLGPAADTNNNFVSGDYSSGGLTGNAVNKFVSTGYIPASHSPALNSAHYAVFSASNISATDALLGANDPATNSIVSLWGRTASNITYSSHHISGQSTPASSLTDASGMLLINRTDSSQYLYYRNQTSLPPLVYTPLAMTSQPLYIFCRNNNGVPVNFSARTLTGYSFGAGLTPAEVQVYYQLLRAFHIRIGRSL